MSTHISGEETLAELLETNILNCNGCGERYDTPRLLPCLHTLCQTCLQQTPAGQSQKEAVGKKQKSKLTNGEADNEGGGGAFQCPLCQSSISLPNGGGVMGFPVNVFLMNILELFHYKYDEERSCDYCKFAGLERKAACVCLDCKDNICDDCSEAHRRTKLTRGHLVVPFAQIQKGLYDHDVRASQRQMCPNHEENNVTAFCTKCEVLVCQECRTSSHQGHSVMETEDSVNKYKLQMELLLSGLQQQIPSIHSYVEYLQKHLSDMDDKRLKLQSDLENQANTLHTMIDEHKDSIMERVNDMCTMEISDLDLKIRNLKTAAKSLETNADFLQCFLHHGSSKEVLTLHRPLTHRLTQLVHMSLDGIEKKLKMAFSPNIPIRKDIEELFGSLALGHVPLTQKEAQQLSGSACLSMTSLLPNTLNTAELLGQFEGKGQGDTKDIWPTGVTTTVQDDIVIADRDNHVVKIFSKDGILKVEVKGEGENKVGTPFDVAALPNGNIVITDYEKENLKVFDPMGKHVFTMATGLKHPRGVTVSKSGEIIVVDCHHLRITVHSPQDGRLINTIPAVDADGKKVLVDPYYLTVNSVGNVFVTDTAAPNIKVFSPDGEYLAQFGTYGTKSDQSLQPFGICCDDYGYIHVADNHNDRIHLLKPDGNFHKFVLDKDDDIWHPMAVAVDAQGHLVVTEALGKVKKFKYI